MRVRSQLIDSEGNPIGVTGNKLAVDATITGGGDATAANQATEITSLQLLDDAIATAGAAITTKANAVAGTDGTNARILKTDASGELQVDVLSSALPSGAAEEHVTAGSPHAVRLTDGSSFYTGFTETTGALMRSEQATAARQDTTNGKLDTLNGKIFAVNGSSTDINLRFVGSSAIALGTATSAASIPIVANYEQLASQTITSLGGTQTCQTTGCSSIVVSIIGTWNATIVFDGITADADYEPLAALKQGVGIVSSTTTNGKFTIPCGGFNQVRIRTTAYASGTIVVSAWATLGVNTVKVFNETTYPLNIADGGNSITVDGSVTADTELPTAAALSDSTANPTAPMVGAALMGYNGSTWERVVTSGDASDGVATQASGHLAVTSHLLGYNGTTWDRLRSSITSGLVVDSRRAQTLLFASVSTSSSGATAIVAADGTKKIKVVSYSLVADGAVTVKWQSASTDLTGAMSFAANGGISVNGGSMSSWVLQTAVNEALNINLGGAVGVRGHISYFLEA